MSNRTSESNRAILSAWKREQELVQEGKGTREWTVEQQQTILNKGKAYDEDGYAFEGQHMKSAEKYPEYQGDPGNIQFLTRTEHFEAHCGSWRNPTNWYFNPSTKEKIDFGDGDFIPCSIIELSHPIKIASNPAPRHKKDIQTTVSKKNSFVEKPENHHTESGPKLTVGEKLEVAREVVVEMYNDFKTDHPVAIERIKAFFPTAISIGVACYSAYKSSGGDSNSKSSNKQSDNSIVDVDTEYSSDAGVEDDSDSIKRSSPKEHIVSGHKQRYGKNKEWIYKDDYTRSKKKE